ncbi:M48 family metallopeptidase [bacterium]
MKNMITKINRCRRKSIGLYITRDAHLEVRAPYWVTKNMIYDFVEKKKDWIEKNIKNAKIKKEKKDQLDFEIGGKLLFLGKTYNIIEDKEVTALEFKEDNILVPSKFKSRVKQVFIKSLIKLTEKKIHNRIKYFADLLEVEFNKIKISKATRQWGSCTIDNNLNFSWKLIMAPNFVIDYIIVHELCHLKQFNHSKKYYSEVGKILPDYKKSELWLRKNDYILII